MKNLIKIFSFAAILGFFATSCNTDPCKDVVCGDFGTCNEGTCTCEAGYEQNLDGLCNTEMRAKFIGTYNFSGTSVCGVSGSNAITGSMTVSNSSAGVSKVLINLYGSIITATVNGSALTIDSQVIGGFTYTGSGTYSNNTLSLIINEDDPNVPEVCVYTVNGLKQ